MTHAIDADTKTQTAVIPDTAMAVALDIGGTKISGGRMNLKDGITDFQKVDTPTQGSAFLNAIESLVMPLKEKDGAPAKCLGIASAGTINSETGEIFGATGNLPALRDIGSLKETLESHLGIPVFIENDANAAAYGEARMGAAQGHSEVLMITLGTGVGTGFLIHNALVRGAHFSAGEGGHIAVCTSKARLCTCGRWDCWETFASGTGLAETARRELEAAPNAESSQILSLQNKTIKTLTTHDVITAWRSGDFIAQTVMDKWHCHIAVGLGSLLNVLDPEITVIGGGMAQFVDFSKLTALTQERAMYKNICLKPAELGNKAGIMGAGLLALERVY
jgi:glucokinase